MMHHRSIGKAFPTGLLSLALATSVPGQSSARLEGACTCSQQLDLALDVMRQAILGAPHNAFLMQMHFKAENSTGVQQFDAIAHFERGRTFFETPQYKYYEDAELRLAALPEERKAFIYEVDDRAELGKRQGQYVLWQDSLLVRGEVVECRTITSRKPGASRYIITMEPPANMSWAGVRRVTWTIGKEDRSVRSVRVEYVPGKPLTVLQIDYLRFVPGIRDPRVARSLAEEFLADGGRRGGLKGYELNDRRRNRP